jgi:hypothetical protein
MGSHWGMRLTIPLIPTMRGAPLCWYRRWGCQSQAVFSLLVAEGLFFAARRETYTRV